MEETGKQEQDHKKKQLEIESKHHTNTIDLLRNRKREIKNQFEHMKKSSYNNGKSFESDPQVSVFDRDNPTFVRGIVGTILQQIGVFDRDNPAAPPKRTGNIFPLFDLRKSTGNRASVLLLSDFAANPFTGPVPLTSDLEPDRSGYFPIPTRAGKFLQSLLITGNLFVFTFHYFYYSILYRFVSLNIQYRFRIDGK